MFDTIRLVSPAISEEVAQKIESECVKRQGIEMATGEVLYEITTGDLLGSYDSRVSIKVRRERWQAGAGDGSPPVLVASGPYLDVECSVHKLLKGHNIADGPLDFYSSCYTVVEFLESTFEMRLPAVKDWEVARVDIAEVFYIEDIDDIAPYFRALNASTYPRREVYRFGNTGIWAGGSTTVVKIYYKGAEFYKHDRNRLKRLLTEDVLYKLQDFANHIIRCEVSIKKRKIEYEYGRGATVEHVESAWLYATYEKEVERLIKEGRTEFKVVRDIEGVKRRLFKCYSATMANALLGTWFNFSISGEESARSNMSRATFYRHRKALKDVGIAWVGGQAVAGAKVFMLADFKPVRSDRRHYECAIGF